MTLVIEGTFVEVQRRLSSLAVSPEAHLRVTIVEKNNAADDPLPDSLATAERRNGLIVMPLQYEGRHLNTEVVRMLSEGE